MNCLGCIIRPYIKLGSVCGCPPINIECVHPGAPKFSIVGKYFKMFTLIIILFNCLNFYFMVEYANTLYRSQNYIQIVTLSSEFLFCAGSIFSCLFGLMNHRVMLLEMNEVAKIFEQSKYYGIACFFSPKMMKKNKQCFYVCISIILANIINIIGFCFIFYDSDRYTYFPVKLINRILCCYVESIVTLQFMQFSLFYYIVFKTCFQQIKRILIRKRIDSRCLILDIQLRRLRRLYSAIELSYRQLNVVIRLGFLLWIILVVVLMVLDNYMLIAAVTYNLNYIHAFSLVYTYLHLLGVAVYLFLTEKVTNVNQDILSFLFKYPISKLNVEEAAQVEMLITTLKIQKPALTSYNIFTFGTRLLASISGTVVTYLLVTLQFHSPWEKQ